MNVYAESFSSGAADIMSILDQSLLLRFTAVTEYPSPFKINHCHILQAPHAGCEGKKIKCAEESTGARYRIRQKQVEITGPLPGTFVLIVSCHGWTSWVRVLQWC